jgi:hypothetical protein
MGRPGWFFLCRLCRMLCAARSGRGPALTATRGCLSCACESDRVGMLARICLAWRVLTKLT